MKMQENQLAKPGNQWEGREVCEGSARGKFCETKMETWSCKYGYIFGIYGNFMQVKVTFISKWYLARWLIVLCIISCSGLLL